MKREPTLSPEPAPTIAELQGVQDAWDNVSQDGIRHLHDRLHAIIHGTSALPPEGVTPCIDVTA